MRVYINGKLCGTLARTGAIANSASGLMIGAFSVAGNAAYKGLIDELHIYNKALDENEMSAVYYGTPMPVLWVAAERLAIIIPPRSFSAGSASESICARAQWSDGSIATSYNESCTFYSPTGNGWFSLDPAGPWTKTVSARMAGGETFVYYKDVRAGSPAVAVISGSFSETTQAQSVSPASFSETCSFIMIHARTISGDGLAACTATVFAADFFRNRIAGLEIIITTSRKGTADDAYDTITQPSSSTDANGACTGTLVSVLAGADTIYAYPATDPSRRIQNTVFTEGLVGMWGFDDPPGTTAFDLSPYSNAGTIANPVWADGVFGTCLSFDGATSNIAVPSSNSLELRNAISLEAWAKLDPNEGYMEIIRKEPCYMLRRENAGEGKQFNFYVVTGGGWEPRADSSLVPDSGPNSPWYHIVGTYDKDGGANNLKIYVNGALSAQATKAGTVDTSTNSLIRLSQNSLF